MAKTTTTKTTKDAEPVEVAQASEAVEQERETESGASSETPVSLSEVVELKEPDAGAADAGEASPAASDAPPPAPPPEPVPEQEGEQSEGAEAERDDTEIVEQINPIPVFFGALNAFLEALPPQPEPCESKRKALCVAIDDVMTQI